MIHRLTGVFTTANGPRDFRPIKLGFRKVAVVIANC